MLICTAERFVTNCQAVKPPQTCKHDSIAEVVTATFLTSSSVFNANIEERGLLCSVFTQLGHFIHAGRSSLLLFPLVPALCFVTLSLLPRLFFLAFGKC